jgi:hypothetical protein
MKIDFGSATWKALEMHLKTQLQGLRERNDQPKLDANQTAALRGQIATIKDLLALPTQVTQVPKDDPGYSTTSLDD